MILGLAACLVLGGMPLNGDLHAGGDEQPAALKGAKGKPEDVKTGKEPGMKAGGQSKPEPQPQPEIRTREAMPGKAKKAKKASPGTFGGQTIRSKEGTE
jgi:hypothetical protein